MNLGAITVKLPFAAAIRAGVKRVENRGRGIAPQHIGRPVAIHAGLGWSKVGGADERVRTWWYGHAAQRPLVPADFPGLAGHVIAVAVLAGCHQEEGCCAPWGDRDYGGRRAWHIVLDDIVPLEQPVATRGYLPLPWTLPDDVAAKVLEQVEVTA